MQQPYPNCAGGNVGALEILFPGILKWNDPLEGFGAGSTDHFHTCRLPGDIFSAPGPNKFGYQQPRTGNAYIAVQTYWSVQSYTSYCTSKLLYKLNHRKYCISFYVSLGDTCPSYCNNIGALFSDTIPLSQQFFNYQLNPQVENEVLNNPLGDMLNWTEVRGSFTANGSEKYITLGNFKENISSDQ